MQIHLRRLTCIMVFAMTSSSLAGALFCMDGAEAATTSPVKWLKYQGNPVFSKGGGGAWDSDSSWMYTSSVVIVDSGFRLYYSGYNGANQRVGLATSADGKSWTRSPSNPILPLGSSGAWDSVHASGAFVMKDGSDWKMWYHGYDGSHWKIGYATSPDGISWTKHPGNPIMTPGPDGGWDDNHVGLPCVLKETDVYMMWYMGDDHVNSRVGHATSSDGISWTKYAQNPVLDLGDDGDWDDYGVSSPCVLKVFGTYRMWFSGYSAQFWNIGHASSGDGISWTKHPRNPVVSRGGNGWETNGVLIPCVVHNGTAYLMWYVGVDGANLMKFGYAEGWNRIPEAPTLLGPSDSEWLTTDTPGFSWSFSDPDEYDGQAGCQVVLDDDSAFGSPEHDSGQVNSSSTTYRPVTGLPEGVSYWRARVWDTDGDSSGWSATRAIKIDTRPPEGLSLSVRGGEEYTNNRFACLTVGASDPVPGSGMAYMAFSNDGSAWSSWETFRADRSAWDLCDSRYGGAGADGTKTVYLKVRDLAGNIGAAISTTIILDTATPRTTMGALPATSLKARINLAWSAADANSGVLRYDVQYRAGNGTWTDLLSQTNLTTTQFTGEDLETYSFRARARDRAGNLEDFPAAVDNAITVKLPEPVLSVVTPPENAQLRGKVTLKGTCVPVPDGRAVSKVELRVDNGSWETAGGTLNWSLPLDTTGLSDGAHTLQVRTFDGKHYSAVVERPFRVKNAQPKTNTPADAGMLLLCGVAVALALFVRRRK